ncbi:MAG: hypothetical protein Q4G35_08280 [Propionibacteriaceae bacterium]|nr:hypothetical protein [Propionibacteriaceae bacterium]
MNPQPLDTPTTPIASRYGRQILNALQRARIYQGTVPANVKARRRAANKRARAARRNNR